MSAAMLPWSSRPAAAAATRPPIRRGRGPGYLRRDGEHQRGVPAPVGLGSTASYTLTGPNGFSQAATLDFQGSQAIGFLIENVPAGSGYTLSSRPRRRRGRGRVVHGLHLNRSRGREDGERRSHRDLHRWPVRAHRVRHDRGVRDVARGNLAHRGTVQADGAGQASKCTTKRSRSSGSSGLHFLLNQVPAGLAARCWTVTGKATNGEICHGPKRSTWSQVRRWRRRSLCIASRRLPGRRPLRRDHCDTIAARPREIRRCAVVDALDELGDAGAAIGLGCCAGADDHERRDGAHARSHVRRDGDDRPRRAVLQGAARSRPPRRSRS